MTKDKEVKPIIDNNPVQKGIKRIIVFLPDVKHPKDKVVEELTKIIEARDNEIAESLGLPPNEIGDARFPEEIAQVIKDSLVIDEDEIHKIVFSIAEQHFAPVTVGFKVDLATAIAKADIITIKGRKQNHE